MPMRVADFCPFFGVISTTDDRWRACSLPLLPVASAAALRRREGSRAEAGRGGGKICASRHYSASVDSPLTEVLFLQVFFACAHKSKLSVTQNLIFLCFDEITI
jgi:hypothetical protein